MKRLIFSNLLNKINVPLLLFLIFFLNVKFIVKIIAIVILTLYYMNFKFGLSWKKTRLPLFYFLIILIEIIKFIFITRNYSINYMLVFSFGILQWAISLLAIHYLKFFIEQDTTIRIHNTIRSFFLINFLISLFFLTLLIFSPSSLGFWGHGADISFNHPSAGDTILGVTFDTSTINATINSMGLIYFLYKRDHLFSLICILIIALCTSNITIVFIVITLAIMFLTVRSNKLRFQTLSAVFLLFALYFAISPHNRQYVRNYFVQLYILNKNPELATNQAETKDSLAIIKPQSKVPDSIYAFDNKKLGKALNNFLINNKNNNSSGVPELVLSDEDFNRRPGKMISFFQTYNYLKSDKTNLLFGAGVGNFSSKLAFRSSGEENFGTYPSKFIYTSKVFEKNHLKTFLYYFNRDASKHSVLNYPTSIYNQLLGEYGLIGAFLFIIFYIGYFIKRFVQLTYGKYLIIALLAFFFMEYWFEMYSLIVFFELLMLLNLKESNSSNASKDIAPDFT
jgi:hypothetical protein